MSNETIKVKREDGITTITLNRPDRLNALTAEMGRDLSSAVDEVAADLESRVVVLTGAGRGFCAGEDVKERPADSEEAKADAD